MAVVGLTCGEICRLFCCPPCPSSIAAKLAFLPPEPSTYSITTDDEGKASLHLTERAEFLFSQRELALIDAMKVRTSRRNTIACLHVKITDNPKYTLLFSHGNAVDLGQMSSYYVGLGTRLGCNVFGYDYSGYGDSTGGPSEANIYADAETAWQTMVETLNISPDRIIIYGQSIGSVASVDLATRHQCAGIILHSPLLSGMRVAFPDVRRTYFFDPFPSITKILRVQSVVLIIHGTEDEVIDFSHGLSLYERAPNTVEPLWVEGAGHNDIERFSSYLLRLIKFVNKELPAREAAAAEAAAAARATADALAAVSANGTMTNRSAIGVDGVMALAGMDDDEDGDLGTGTSEERDYIPGSSGNGRAQRSTSTTTAADIGTVEDVIVVTTATAATTTTTTIVGTVPTAERDDRSADDDDIHASSTDKLISDLSESSRPAMAATPTTNTGSTLSVSASPGHALSASERSLPLSADCSDRSPTATPEHPVADGDVSVATSSRGAASSPCVDVAVVDGRDLVYV